MNIEVLFFGKLRELATRQRVIPMMDGARLADLIEYLAKEYGVDFHQEVDHLERLRILINGREYDLLGSMEAQLKDGDTVVFLPLIAGG